MNTGREPARKKTTWRRPMRRKIISMVYFFFVIIIFVTFPAVAQEKKSQETQAKQAVEQNAPGNEYIIGSGDVLDIALWRDDALARQVVVLSDGKISFPLVGEIVAAGKTIAELKKDIADRLADYVPDAVISIEVKQSNSMVIYVTGRVNNPNRFPVNTNVTVLQAISTAGGLNPFAKRNKIKIFRQEGDKTRVFLFKYDEVIDGKNLEQNIALKRGDVIVVP
jgi:polysaccharide export outer membrane protein